LTVQSIIKDDLVFYIEFFQVGKDIVKEIGCDFFQGSLQVMLEFVEGPENLADEIEGNRVNGRQYGG